MSDYDYLVQLDRKTKYHVTNKQTLVSVFENERSCYVFSLYILFETKDGCTHSLFSIDIWDKVH